MIRILRRDFSAPCAEVLDGALVFFYVGATSRLRSDRDQEVPPTGVAPGTGEPLEQKKTYQCPANPVGLRPMAGIGERRV
jgi:hypothetical protein